MQFLETEQSAHILLGLQAAWCVSLELLLLLLDLSNAELVQTYLTLSWYRLI